MYMDRTYVVQHDKLPTHELGLLLWKEGVVREPRIAARLSGTLLDMVERERSGETVDQGLMRATTQMLSDLGANVYVDDFERAFLVRRAGAAGRRVHANSVGRLRPPPSMQQRRRRSWPCATAPNTCTVQRRG